VYVYRRPGLELRVGTTDVVIAEAGVSCVIPLAAIERVVRPPDLLRRTVRIVGRDGRIHVVQTAVGHAAEVERAIDDAIGLDLLSAGLG